MADPTKLLYYTEYNSYKNLQVRPGSIPVTGAPVGAGSIGNWSTTITVEPDSKFSSALIQANSTDFSTVSALRWQAFPSANVVWQTLATDPDGRVVQSMSIFLLINNNQVTFRAETYNDAGGALAFNPITINFIYAIHTLAI